MPARRVLLYVPGDDRHKIEKALTCGADCACLDMEDGVAMSRKGEARLIINAALRELEHSGTERLVRINRIGSGLEEEDLAAALSCHPDGIVLPKVESREDVQWLSTRIEAAELENTWVLGSIHLLVDVETARGMINLKEIASHPRLEGLIFGGEDYAASLGAQRTPEAQEVFTARSLVVMHAKAHGLQAIDMVTVDYRDLEHVRSEALFGAQLGYTGKQIIHPAQVAPVQEAFTPGEDEVARAKALVEAFEAHQKEGHGAFGLNGAMIDMPLVKAAENVLARAHSAEACSTEAHSTEARLAGKM
jgi:citrate lyase beta subunit